MKKNTISFFEIYVSDMQRAKNFYNTVFQCEFNDVSLDNERHPKIEYAFFVGDADKNGVDGALVNGCSRAWGGRYAGVF